MIPFVLFLLTIPAANLTFSYVGVLPVGFGLVAPVAVLWAGAALFLRDLVQEQGGLPRVLAAILLGALVSATLADPHIALASCLAFLVSELADAAVYTPLRRRGIAIAVLTSGLVGAIVDTTLFLGLAFGSYEFLGGMLLAKLYITLLASGSVALWGRRRAILEG